MLTQRAMGLLIVAATLLPLTLPSVAAAQSYYHIEIVVVQPHNRDDAYQEQWPSAQTLNQAQFAGQPIEATAGFRWLGPGEYYFDSSLARLKASGQYTVLAHKAWIQQGFNRDRAIPLNINQSIDGLHGSVSLGVSRFLHIAMDINLINSGKRYQLEENRRIKSNDAAYFDNPAFGVLVYVNKVQ